MGYISESHAIKAWHFVGDKLRDGTPVPEDGEVLVHHGEIKLCSRGLHASRHPYDALTYAPGNILCRVECWGDVIEDVDKLVCTHRRIIARRDAADGLLYFARMQAASVVHLWGPSDVVLDFLLTGDKRLSAEAARAAWEAARAAAWEAATAAWEEAGAAATAEAWAAAREAARAAWEAATAAWEAARAAAWAARAAAWAARAAAWEEAGAATAEAWNELVSEAFEGVL